MSNGNESDILNIAITFPAPSSTPGPTRFGTRITSEVCSRFIPDYEVTGRALDEFQRQGFTVTKKGRLTASIRGTKENFERLFGTQLTRFTLEADEFTRRRSGDSVLFPAQDAPWNPEAAIAELIDDAYIQWPYIYMSQRFSATPPSPIPPQVNYHHLRVPGDVVQLVNAAKVHREGTTGKGVRVAMVDSGFAHNSHPYFGEMGYNTSVVLAPGASDPHLDGNSHGTGESANLLAIAPDATFIGVKLDNERSPFLGASLLEGFQTAVEQNPQVISVSLGYDLRRMSSLPRNLVALEAEVAEAVADGIVVVFSAGNGHVAFPGMMPDVISAGGVYVSESGEMRASDYASAFASRIYPGRNVPDFCGLVGMASNNADYIMLPIQVGSDIDRDNSAHDGTGSGDGWAVFSGTSAAAPPIGRGLCSSPRKKSRLDSQRY